MNAVVFSSERQDWETPQAFFDALNAEFGFTLDACALPENAKCDRFYTPDDDALTKRWDGVVWMNPPYGYSIGKWVLKANTEATIYRNLVVGLIPAKTDTTWWHEHVMQATEIRFVRGRLRFSGSHINAPFASAIVVWRPGQLGWPRFSVMDRILDEAVTTISNTPGSDGDFTYDNSRSYGVETDRWEGPTPPEEWAELLATPTNLVSYADDGIDVPYERDALDRVALVGDDGRDAFGELMDERAEPHVRRDAA